MNYSNNSKQFVIDALFKLLDSSPIRNNNFYGGIANSYNISQQELNIWVNYINSVLDILSGYINPAEISLTKVQIENIAFQSQDICSMRVLNIERELLNLAKNVLKYY